MSGTLDIEKPKFKAGDIARVKYRKNVRVFIIEVQTQTCYADVTQIWYTVRQFGIGTGGGVGKDYTRMSSIELEAVTKVPDDLIEQAREYKKIKLEKEAAIKKQDFDTAAELRNKEKGKYVMLAGEAELKGFDIDEVIAEL